MGACECFGYGTLERIIAAFRGALAPAAQDRMAGTTNIADGTDGGPMPPPRKPVSLAPNAAQVATPDATGAAFHAHLDACAQCREHPMDLCAVGAGLLVPR